MAEEERKAAEAETGREEDSPSPPELEPTDAGGEAADAGEEGGSAGQSMAEPEAPGAGSSGAVPRSVGDPLAMDLAELQGSASRPDAEPIDLLADVNLNVKIELGRTRMLVEDVLRLGEGSVVELEKLAGDPVDVFVNDRLVARGEVLVLNDSFCVRISEVLHSGAEEGVKPRRASA